MDIQRKRLLYRARHMGTNENDIFFGSFAEETLEKMTKEQLDLFETLMEVSDPDLFMWVTKAKPVPPEHDSEVLRMLQNFTLAQARR